MRYFVASAALCAAALPVAAQDGAGVAPVVAVTAAPVVAVPAPAPTSAVLRAGTPITLRILEEVTTKEKRARVGQRVIMEIAAPVEVNGVTVIPAGTPAWGEITSVRNKGMWGKSGHLEARALYLRLNGRQIRLSGTFDDKGVTGTAGVVAALAVVPIAGFFVTGTSAVLPAGGEVGGFIDEDVQLAFAAAQPAPLTVPVPAAPLPVAVPAQ